MAGLEVKITPEEQLLRSLLSQSDAEQIRVYDRTLPGMPIKCVIERSQKLAKQVSRVPQYYELKDGTATIGYQKDKDILAIEDYGVMSDRQTSVIGQRQRGA
jgi:flagellar biosynthesis/type III secretory pathway chaperone